MASQHPEAGDEQPHHAFPPPSSLHNGHGHSNSSNGSHGHGHGSHGLSNGSHGHGNNGNGPMAVPGGRTANLREMGFAGARSPPSNKSRRADPSHSSHSQSPRG